MLYEVEKKLKKKKVNTFHCSACINKLENSYVFPRNKFN